MAPELLEFIRLFNQEKFFEAHEVLEDLWRREKGPARIFHQALIQTAAALVHIQKHNPEGARRLLAEAEVKFGSFPAVVEEIDTAALLYSTRRCLTQGGAPFPRILFQQ